MHERHHAGITFYAAHERPQQPLTIVGVGSTVITATQAGNVTYLPANAVQQTLTITTPQPVTPPPAIGSGSGGGSCGMGSGLATMLVMLLLTLRFVAVRRRA